MKGQYKITVKNRILQYQFVIRRNITIIRGQSATGKTKLVDMIREYYENGEKSGVSLQCDKECAVLEGRRWKILLEDMHDSIVFIDEANEFLATDEFAECVQKSNNYYVIVTRESLPNLPYSVDEVYGIRTSGKYGNLQQTYQEFYHIYGDVESGLSGNPEVLILEDSNAGYEFFEEVAKEKNCQVISAQGKSNIFKMLKNYSGKKILAIADGAAFGAEMDRVMKTVMTSEGMTVYLPESFEWLILKSGIIKDKIIDSVIGDPGEHIESSEYMSWERFFAAFLIEKTKDSFLQYSKSKLNDAYKNKRVLDKVLEQMPNGLL